MAITSRQYVKTSDLDPAKFACSAAGLTIVEEITSLSINPATGVITFTDESGATTNITPRDDGDLSYNGVTGEVTHTNSLGATQTITIPVATDAGDLAYNGATGELTHTNSDGTTQTVNLPLENFLASASFNPATNILTLTLTDGTTVTVDMVDLVDIYALTVADTSCIDMTLSGNGSSATPWQISATPIIDPAAENVLSCGASGLLVDWCDVFDALDTTFPTLDCGALPTI